MSDGTRSASARNIDGKIGVRYDLQCIKIALARLLWTRIRISLFIFPAVQRYIFVRRYSYQLPLTNLE
jgi:hypothetical protein